MLAALAVALIVAAAPQQVLRPETVVRKQGPTAFQLEEAMTTGQRMKRWTPLIAKAAKKFGVPQSWLRAVMLAESGGRTTLTEGKPIVSGAGAMGLMQLMPSTWKEMRAEYALGDDPFDPHDNIFAGAAYLRWLRQKYGYPTMFAAYNDGPGNLEQRLKDGDLLPAETRLYLVNVTANVEGLKGAARGMAQLTRPNGEPIQIDCAQVTRIRAPMQDEYADTVQAVITIGKVRQGVREDVGKATTLIRAHGGAI
jgi:soluble lytic murein transglycosylase-like protein